MFPMSAFNQPMMGFPFLPPQVPTSLYQSQYGAAAVGFNPQAPPQYQQVVVPRGQSLPASGRQYVQPPSSSSRHQKHSHYPPPAAPQQQYEQHSNHGSKSKKHHKRRSISPSGVADQSLYSDHEERNVDNVGKSEEQQQVPSRSQSPAVGNVTKTEGTADSAQQQKSEPVESTNVDIAQGGVARSEEAQAVSETDKQKSKKKKHHRREHHHNNNKVPQPPTQAYFGEYPTELPPQLKVHLQPLYNTYNQAYEESIRRGDISLKHAKRATRLPPEIKQKLLPHEEDKQALPAPIPQQQQPFSYVPAPGYSQNPFTNIRQGLNPYNPFGLPPPSQPKYYGSAPGSNQYNALQPWSNAGVVSLAGEQEIHHLLDRIRSLEGEVHRLQRKLNKKKSNKHETTQGQDDNQQQEDTHSHRRSKHRSTESPRQTPVIVELNNATGEAIRDSSSKHSRPRTISNTSAQQEQEQPIQQDSAAKQQLEEVTKHTKVASPTVLTPANNPTKPDVAERSQAASHAVSDTEVKSTQAKPTREEAAAQPAATHVNNRQGFVNVAPQPQGPAPPPPPPSVPQLVRPQVSNQQQFIYQQGVLPPQGPQIRVPAPRFPMPANVRYPVDPYQQQQQFVNLQQRAPPNQNYNQSNNNELLDSSDEDDEDDDEDDDDNEDDDEDNNACSQQQQKRSAEKILDAFERFYVNHGKPATVPMKVKYIPEEENSNPTRLNHRQLNTNNNNCHRSTSRQSQSSSSESMYSNSQSTSRHSIYDNHHRKSTTSPFI